MCCFLVNDIFTLSKIKVIFNTIQGYQLVLAKNALISEGLIKTPLEHDTTMIDGLNLTTFFRFDNMFKRRILKDASWLQDNHRHGPPKHEFSAHLHFQG